MKQKEKVFLKKFNKEFIKSGNKISISAFQKGATLQVESIISVSNKNKELENAQVAFMVAAVIFRLKTLAGGMYGPHMLGAIDHMEQLIISDVENLVIPS